MPPAVPATSRRFDTVDVLRGISIVLVILLHTMIRMSFGHHTLKGSLPQWLYHLLLQNGDNGVTIFFAISGFLIAYTSIQRFGSLAAMMPTRFYRIRFARIVPPLLLILAVLTAMHLAHIEGFIIRPKQGSLPGALFAALTFHLNWYEGVHGYLPACWDVLWSLSVEEMFYLFFPLACLLLLRWRRGLWPFVAMLVAFIAMGPFARTIWTAGRDVWQEKCYLGGMDAIAMGVLTALIASNLGAPRLASETWDGAPRLSATTLLTLQALGGFFLFGILLWPSWPWLHPTLRFLGRSGLDGTILPLGTCLVLFGSVLRGRPGRTWTAPLRWFGRHSYEVYLTHEFIVIGGTELYLKTQRGPLGLWFIGILLATAPLGWLFAHFYAEPLNRRLR